MQAETEEMSEDTYELLSLNLKSPTSFSEEMTDAYQSFYEEGLCDELPCTSVPSLPPNSSSTSHSNKAPDPSLRFFRSPKPPKCELQSAPRKKSFPSLSPTSSSTSVGSLMSKRRRRKEHDTTSFPNHPSFFNQFDSQSIPPSVSGPQYPEKVPVVDQGSTSGTGESLKTDVCGSPVQSLSESGGERTALEEMWPPVTVEHNSTEETLHPQISADEKVSEEGVQDELPWTSVPRLPPNSSSTSHSNITRDPLLPFGRPIIARREHPISPQRKKSFPSLSPNSSSTSAPSVGSFMSKRRRRNSSRPVNRVLEHDTTSFPPPSPSFTEFPSSQSITPSVSGPQYPEKVPVVDQGSTSGTGESLKREACGFPLQSLSESGGERTALEEMWPPVTVEHNSTEEALHPQMTAYEKVSEEGVQDELPCTSVPRLPPNSSSTSPSNISPDPWLTSLQYEEQLLKHDLMSAQKHKSVPRPLSNSSSTSPSSSSRSMIIVPELVSSGFRSFFDRSTCSQSFIPSVAGSQYPDKIRNRGSSCLTRSPSVPSPSLTTSAKNRTFTRSKSLPVMLLKSSCGSFTPDITAEEHEESYRFQCSCPGLYQCSVTGLVFHMEAEGDVVYRIVPWNRRLLAQHHKQPAGPLFDIKCLQQCVRQLHLPHCEIRSTGGCEFLSVAHVNDDGIEIIAPHKITETHVVINITGFSGFGNVKDEDSPPDPVRALVLLFYRTPAAPDLEYLLNVLLLPKNVVLRDVLRKRKEIDGDEIYIETSPHCKLHPKQEYSLSTCPQDDSVLVQPTTAELDNENYDNYFPSFQVSWETMMKHMKLCLRDTRSPNVVWERRVCLSSAGGKRSCGPSALNLPPHGRLSDIRSSFIDGISGPVLQSLLDKLLEKKVITDSERESAEEMRKHRGKARFVIDTVRKKGEAASSEMIQFLCELDPFLCKHLGLI